MKEWRLLGRDVWFYLSGSADVSAADWHADPWLYPSDWGYQLDRETEYFSPKDAAGIPLREFRAPLGARYLPSRITAYGLAHWNRWRIQKASASEKEFLRVASWLRASHVRGRYEHEFELAGMASGWISCISQGEALSALVRAHHMTGDPSYLETAHQAGRWLLLPEAQGGLLSRLPDGSPFLEEYPGTVYQHVLNGCLYAAVGLSDLLRSGGAEVANARTLFHALIDGIASNLQAWDVNGWSTYDFYPVGSGRVHNLNTMTYQVLQVIMLDYLADTTGDARLRATSARWKQSAQRLTKRLGALGGKLAYRVVARW